MKNRAGIELGILYTALVLKDFEETSVVISCFVFFFLKISLSSGKIIQ